MGRYDILVNKPPIDKPSTRAKATPSPTEPDSQAGQVVNPPTSQLTSKPAQRPASKTVEKSFYITERLHKKLDEAVRYFQEVHGIRKADRSSIVNAILDNEANWSNESLDLILDRVIRHLTSKLTG
jgi:hypothetical protein